MENKKYYIKSWHDVHEYSYKDGELNNVNNYNMSDIINADNPKDAIDKYISKILGYMYDIDNIENEGEMIYFDMLVDSDNMQATNEQVQAWKQSKVKLYNDCVSIEIYELNKITELCTLQ